MKKSTTLLFKLIVITLAFSTLATGCVQTKPKPVTDCPIPSGNLVNEAFETARTTLSRPDCRYQFDTVFQSLLTICKGDPGIENKKKFSDLLMWAKGEGIISSKQASELYTAYFSHRFVSLPDDYRTCSLCPRLEIILADCTDELKKKEQGLLKVCSDKATFAKASQDLQNIDLILEATCSACYEE
ncbi:MAG: hypothetical protein MI892_08205 [Desulfobacterales bacterium]|nr:hypothetical protein [Desulfobacterales bacterium]